MRKCKQFSYGSLPTIRIPRSSFDLSYGHKTSMNVGEIVPIYCDMVYPGDTFKNTTTMVTRSLNSFIKPVMDNVFMDIMYFSVPCRLLFDDWEKIFGKGDPDDWTSSSRGSLSVPSITLNNVALSADNTKAKLGSLLDYFGDIPCGVAIPASGVASGTARLNVSQMPYRAYAKVFNDWFRDENTQYNVVYKGTSLDRSYSLTADPPSAFGVNNIINAYPAKANKVHDRFTSTLIAPQKGSEVDIPVGERAPLVFTDNATAGLTRGSIVSDSSVSLKTSGSSGALQVDSVSGGGLTPILVGSSDPARGISVDSFYFNGDSGAKIYGAAADLSEAAAASVNDLRFAFQLQKQLERFARGGTRYTEYIQSAFGVTSPDARLQRSEYLGGKRLPLSIQQVAQTSKSETDSPLGDVGALSLSAGRCGFSKSFTEHCIVLGVAIIRYYHTYQQGIPEWHRNLDRVDFYDPVFSNIGEQPIYKTALYAGANPSSIFGYNEAWSYMRYKENVVSGALRTGSGANLDYWHFGDNYASAPTLNEQFLQENAENVNRTLSFEVTPQTPPFIVDLYFKQTAVRPMPLYSVPGLIDHH